MKPFAIFVLAISLPAMAIAHFWELTIEARDNHHHLYSLGYTGDNPPRIIRIDWNDDGFFHMHFRPDVTNDERDRALMGVPYHLIPNLVLTDNSPGREDFYLFGTLPHQNIRNLIYAFTWFEPHLAQALDAFRQPGRQTLWLDHRMTQYAIRLLLLLSAPVLTRQQRGSINCLRN